MLSVRILLATSAAFGLVAVSGASGAAINAFSATGAPSHVKPATSDTYTITLTNDASSPTEADRAKIGIAAGFVPGSVQAVASAAGDCVGSSWVADGTLIADGKIHLKRPSGGRTNTRLCPGATLTVVFSAASAGADGTYIWATELLKGSEAFVLAGGQPTVRVDGTPPGVTVTSHPADPSNVTSPTFGFSASESASFQCKLDGGALEPCSSPTSYSELADGSHTFTVKATDAAGNTGEASYTWLIETTLPIVTLTEKPNQASNSSTASFSFTASKPATFECKRDGGAFQSCTSPTSYDGLADGAHTFAVRATDAAGNVGPATRHSWAVDTVAPTVTVTQKPGHPSNDATPSFSFAASEASSFECKLDGAVFTTCTSPKSYTVGDGAHTFTVKATDAAGNAGEASYRWTIDTVAPSAVLTRKPADPTNSRSATFEFSASEPASFQCKVDGGAFALCSSPTSYSGLADGSHSFTVKATDAAGNTGAESYTWLIETTLPVVTLTDKPKPLSKSSTASFSFTASKPATFECKGDAGAFESCTSPASYAGLADGTHSFSVRATDSVGNVGPETRYAWAIDTVAPTVTLTQKPRDPTKDRASTFSFSASEPANLECRLDGAAFEPCTSPQSYTSGDGRHSFSVKASDAAGNAGEATHAWTIDTTGPTAAIAQGPADPTNSRSASFQFSASEAGATFQCKLDDGAFASCASPHAYGNLGDGRHTFVVRAGDALSNHGPEIVYAWSIETRAPAVAVTSEPGAVSNSTSASFSFSADEDATFQCNLDDRGFDPCTSPASYAGLREGGHSFAVRATDAAGNVSAASRSWTIDVTAPQTTLDSGPPPTTTATSAAFTFSATEPATFQCRLDGGSFSPCASPVTYAGLATGLHQFAVRSVDAAGNADATPAAVEWTVTAAAVVVPRRTASSALVAPAAGARVTRPPLLRWRAMRGATYYNVQLYRGSRKVLTAWPTGARLQLSARWTFNGRVQRLEPGVYRWYVWPGYGRAPARRYGRLLGTSTFVVGRSGR